MKNTKHKEGLLTQKCRAGKKETKYCASIFSSFPSLTFTAWNPWISYFEDNWHNHAWIKVGVKQAKAYSSANKKRFFSPPTNCLLARMWQLHLDLKKCSIQVLKMTFIKELHNFSFSKQTLLFTILFIKVASTVWTITLN